jgi:hypothetical protein
MIGSIEMTTETTILALAFLLFSFSANAQGIWRRQHENRNDLLAEMLA